MSYIAPISGDCADGSWGQSTPCGPESGSCHAKKVALIHWASVTTDATRAPLLRHEHCRGARGQTDGGDRVAVIRGHGRRFSRDCILDLVYPLETHNCGLSVTPVGENSSRAGRAD